MTKTNNYANTDAKRTTPTTPWKPDPRTTAPMPEFDPSHVSWQDFDVTNILDLLRLARPHDSAPEQFLGVRLMRYLAEHSNTRECKPLVCPQGEVLAYYAEVLPEGGGQPTTLFSCHVDSIHRREGMQVPLIDRDGMVRLPSDSPSSCLGADDAAGMWIMLHMIDAGVPGTYLFHRGEEVGGIGSKGVARHYAYVLEQHKHAVAFDRKATHSVITHQGMGRCCSDTFAQALADALNDHLPEAHAFMTPDDTGVYTDTAEYVDYVPECTNLSVGYYYEHTMSEHLDLTFLTALRDACLRVDWSALPVKREPGDDGWDYSPFDTLGRATRPADGVQETWDTHAPRFGTDTYLMANYDDLCGGEAPLCLGQAEITAWVRENPERAGELIYDLFGMLDE